MNTFKINTKNMMRGLSILESLPIPYDLKKPTQELILAAIRAEEHLIKLPTHPNNRIYRACVHCRNETNNALHIFTECPIAYYSWKLYEAVIYITTTKSITVKPELVLMMRLPPKLDTLPRTTRNYAHLLSIIYRRALYNIYYDNILQINKNEIVDLMQKLMQLIKSYTINCYQFMKVNGDPELAAWLQFGMQETR